MGRALIVLTALLAVLAAGCGDRQPAPVVRPAPATSSLEHERALAGLGDGCSRYDLLPVDGPARPDARAAAAAVVHGDSNMAAPVYAQPIPADADHVVVHATQDVLDWFVQLRTDRAGRWRATWVARCWAPPSGNAEPDPAAG